MNRTTQRHVYFFGRRPLGGTVLNASLRTRNVSLTQFTRKATCRARLSQGVGDVLVVDLVGCETEALELLEHARQLVPRIAAVALVSQGDVRATVAAMRAGACECLEKPVTAKRFQEAIRSRLDARPLPVAVDLLTAREEQVLRGVLAGKTSREIAAESRCSTRTVEVHRRHILRKLKAHRMVDLFRHVFGP